VGVFILTLIIEVTMKPNRLTYTLSKRQLECLILVSLAELRHKRPSFKDLRDTIARTNTNHIYDAFKLGSSIQKLERAGLIKVRDLPENLILVFQNSGVCQKSYHVSDKGREHLTIQVLNQAY